MNLFPGVLYLAGWVSLIVVNFWIAKEKGRDAVMVSVASVFAAPLMYLYLLAVPPKG